jgi:hypothetical protein
VVPNATWELAAGLVVQVIVAEVAVMPLELTALMVGIDAAPPVERSSRAGAAQAAEPDTEEHETEVAVAAVLSHRSNST